MQEALTSGLEREHVRKLIRQFPGRCSAMNLEGLTRVTGMDRRTVLRAIEMLVDSGEVESLRPLVGGRFGSRPGRNVEYYRLLRDTDEDFLWEQEMTVRLPSARIFDVRQEERRAVSAGRKSEETNGEQEELNWKPALMYS